MLNQVEIALQQVRSAAKDQSNRVRSELNLVVDEMTAAKVAYVTDCDRAQKLREEAEQIEADAKMAFNTKISNALAIIMSVEKQIADGEMITGQSQLPAPTLKPKLVGKE